MYYYFQFFFSKLANFLLHFLFIPISVFVIISPVVFMAIYALENNITVSIQNLKKVDSENTVLQNVQSPSLVIGENRNVLMNAEQKDYRAIVLDSYFSKYNSPLNGFGQVFVEACAKYNAPADCTTLPAIAYVETKLCTLAASNSEKNCWGFGGSPPNRIHFKNFDEAIDLITNRLVNRYGPEYMTNPVSMQYVYCGPNCHSWGRSVQQQRESINRMAEELGYGRLF